MRKIKQSERPFLIRYIAGTRCLLDSAITLAGAQERAADRLAKKKSERVEVYHRGQLVYEAIR